MKKRVSKIPAQNYRTLPADARRVIHPQLGIRVWLIDGKYYRSRRDYLYPPTYKKGGVAIVADTSIKL